MTSADPTKISENKEVQKLRLSKNVNDELHVLNQYLYHQIELSDSWHGKLALNIQIYQFKVQVFWGGHINLQDSAKILWPSQNRWTLQGKGITFIYKNKNKFFENVDVRAKI